MRVTHAKCACLGVSGCLPLAGELEGDRAPSKRLNLMTESQLEDLGRTLGFGECLGELMSGHQTLNNSFQVFYDP